MRESDLLRELHETYVWKVNAAVEEGRMDLVWDFADEYTDEALRLMTTLESPALQPAGLRRLCRSRLPPSRAAPPQAVLARARELGRVGRRRTWHLGCSTPSLVCQGRRRTSLCRIYDRPAVVALVEGALPLGEDRSAPMRST